MEEPIGSGESLRRRRIKSFSESGYEEIVLCRNRSKSPSESGSEESFHRRRRTKSPSESGSEESLHRRLSSSNSGSDDTLHRRRGTNSPSESNSEESLHRRRRTKSPSKSGSDDSLHHRRRTKSFSEPLSEESLHLRRRTKSPSESGSDDSLHRRRRTNSDESLRRRRNAKTSSKGGSKESLHRRRRIKSPSESGSEESLHRRRRTTKSFSKSGSDESLRRRHSAKSNSESGSEESFSRKRSSKNSSAEKSLHFSETEKNLQSGGEGTRQGNRSHQAKKTKKKWDTNVIRHLPLYRAALMGVWEAAERIFNLDSGAITAKITLLNETALHIVVGTGDHFGFVEKLVSLMCERSLPLTQVDLYGNTALAVAAIVGNVKAAEILVRNNELLPLFKNRISYSPLHLAAKYGQKDMILYLLSVTKDENLFIGKFGARLLNLLITFDIYDVALDMLNRQPKLAIEKDQYGITALEMLAKKPDVFESGSQLGFWQRLLYHCLSTILIYSLQTLFITQTFSTILHVCIFCTITNSNAFSFVISGFIVKILDAPLPVQHGDVENPPEISKNAGALYQLLTAIRLATFRKLVTAPYLKNVHDTRVMYVQACKLVRRLCEEALKVGGMKCVNVFSTSILSAAEMGTLEVATEIIRVYPYSIWFSDRRECNIFQLAVLNRQERIYNLIYQMTSHKHFAAAFLDKYDNNILHLAGEFAPSNKISGAALQLQRELQWFKEVERLVQPSYRTMKNEAGSTPRMVFNEEHDSLVYQGEKWMKITASSCTVVAALVATVAFAAVFTAPGGNSNDHGIPILVKHSSFMVFAATDALALTTSSISVMMFLGILTSRYSEEDFLKSLPKRLIIGLVSLFISISSMVAAFSASLYLVLVHQLSWVWIPIIIFAFIPVLVFAMLQFPLLVEMISSTYGRNIFCLQSNEIIHYIAAS